MVNELLTNSVTYHALILTLSIILSSFIILLKLFFDKKSILTDSITYLIIGVYILGVLVMIGFFSFIMNYEIGFIHLFLFISLPIASAWVAYTASNQRNVIEQFGIEKNPLAINVSLSKLFIILGLLVSILGVGNFIGESFLRSIFEGMSAMTATITLLISTVGLKHFFPRTFKLVPDKLIYLPLLIALTALSGHILNLPYLYALSSIGGTSVPTAVSAILLSMFIILKNNLDRALPKIIASTCMVAIFLFTILPRLGLGYTPDPIGGVVVVLSPMTSVAILSIALAYVFGNFHRI